MYCLLVQQRLRIVVQKSGGILCENKWVGGWVGGVGGAVAGAFLAAMGNAAKGDPHQQWQHS